MCTAVKLIPGVEPVVILSETDIGSDDDVEIRQMPDGKYRAFDEHGDDLGVIIEYAD